MRHRYLIVVVGLVVVLGGTAAAAAEFTSRAANGPAPIAYAPVSTASRAPVSPETALARALAGDPGGAVASARIGVAPSWSDRPASPWLYATVRVPGMEDGQDIEPMWEADLVEGATVEQSGTAANVRDDFGGSTFDAVLADGSQVANAGGGLGDVARGQQFSSASDGSVRAEILRGLSDAGLSPISVAILHPLGPAPAVVASAPDVHGAAVGFVALEKALFGDPPNYEGYYLELRDANGKAFVRASASFRTGAGRFWVDPQWASLVGEKSFGRPPRVGGSANPTG